MPGPGDWYDGNGDPFEAPKYLRAREALERGVSPEMRAKLEDAIGEYELIHTPAGPNGEDVPDPPSQREGDNEVQEPPGPEEPEPAAPPAAAPAPAPSSPRRTPMQTFVSRPRDDYGGVGALFTGEAAAPQPAQRGDTPFAIGARNPFSLGDDAVGVGAKLSRMLPSWLGGSSGTVQQSQRSFVEPDDASHDVSVYPVAKAEEQANQRWAERTDPTMYNLGKGSVETLATAPLMLTGAGEAAALGTRLGVAGAQQLAARAAPSIAEIAAGGGLQGMASGALEAGGESEAPTASGVANDMARGGVRGGGAGFATAGLMGAAPRGAVAAVPLGIAGATYGAVESEDPSVGGRLLNAAKYGVGAGVGGSALLGLAAPNVSRKALEALADSGAGAAPVGAGLVRDIGKKAARLRAGAAGGYGAEVDKLAKAAGKPPDEVMEQLGNNVERLNIHKRRGLFKFLPSTPGVYAKNAERVVERVGPEVDATLREAGDQGVTIPREDITKPLRGKARAISVDTDEDAAKVRAFRKMANRVENKDPELLSPRRVFDLKKKYERAGGYRGDRNAPLSLQAKAAANREAAGVPRAALYQAMREQAYRGTPVNKLGPGETGTLQRFEGAMQDYGPANTVKILAHKRMAHGMGNNPVPLSASHGGLTGLLIHGANTMGRDIGANALRGVEQIARTAPVAPPLAFPAAAGALLGTGAAAPPQRPQVPPQAPAPAQQPSPMPSAPLRNSNNAAPPDNGLHLPEKLREAVRSNPGALGPQASSLQSAFSTGDEGEIAAAIQKAMEDPDFRTRVLPSLQ